MTGNDTSATGWVFPVLALGGAAGLWVLWSQSQAEAAQRKLAEQQARYVRQQAMHQQEQQRLARKQQLNDRLANFQRGTLPAGLDFYHKTLAKFPGTDNTSHYFTQAPPASDLTSRDSRLLKYKSKRPLNVLKGPSPTGVQPLKQAAYECMTDSTGKVYDATHGTLHRDRLFVALWEAGVDGVVGYSDPTNTHEEVLVAFDDADRVTTHPLKYDSQTVM